MTKAVGKVRLRELEDVIEHDGAAFLRVGNALLEIRHDRLYEDESFAEYLDRRWPQFESARNYQLMNAAYIIGELENSTKVEFLPVQETQVRPLTKLGTFKQHELGKVDGSEWVEAWERAVKVAQKNDAFPTEKTVKVEVDRILKARKAAGLPEPVEAPDASGVFVGDAESREWYDTLPADRFDLMLTDPPWAEDSISTYSAAGKAALKALRPGGVAAVYLGKIFLPQVIAALGQYLDYEWCFCLYYPESQMRIRKAQVYDCWRPVAIMRKPGPRHEPAYGRDLIQAPREKGSHPWQQALGPAQELVKRYSARGGWVLDPFVGGGTFPLAAKLEGRKFLAFDKDEDTVKIAASRVANGA